MIIFVLTRSPATLYSTFAKEGCLVKFPANNKRVPILWSSKNWVKSFLLKTEENRDEVSSLVCHRHHYRHLGLATASLTWPYGDKGPYISRISKIFAKFRNLRHNPKFFSKLHHQFIKFIIWRQVNASRTFRKYFSKSPPREIFFENFSKNFFLEKI